MGLFDMDEIIAIGMELNVVKYVVKSDPALGRLMVTAGIGFF